MQELDTLKAVVAKLTTDFSTFTVDVQAKLATLAANTISDADKQTLADIATNLTGFDTAVAALDASLNPAPVTPAAPTA